LEKLPSNKKKKRKEGYWKKRGKGRFTVERKEITEKLGANARVISPSSGENTVQELVGLGQNAINNSHEK